MGRREAAKRALPESFRQKSTKSGSKGRHMAVITKRTGNKKGKGAMPGDSSLPAIFDYTNSKRK